MKFYIQMIEVSEQHKVICVYFTSKRGIWKIKCWIIMQPCLLVKQTDTYPNQVKSFQRYSKPINIFKHLKDVRGCWDFDRFVNIHNAYLSFKSNISPLLKMALSSCSSPLPCFCPSCFDGESFVVSTPLFLYSFSSLVTFCSFWYPTFSTSIPSPPSPAFSPSLFLQNV